MADVPIKPFTARALGQDGQYQIGVNVADRYQIANPDGRTILVVDASDLSADLLMTIATPGTAGPAELGIDEQEITLAHTDARLHAISGLSPGIYGTTLTVSFASTQAGVRLGAIRP